MRGIYPANSTLAPTGTPRIRQAYENMAALAEMVGANLEDCVRLVVYTTDMYRYRPICNDIQIELWGDDPNTYPPRTIIEVDRLNEDDIVEVEGTFHLPRGSSDADAQRRSLH
jgi:enamine deaminase RidA (YjgF/YER057c/UK114 family)